MKTVLRIFTAALLTISIHASAADLNFSVRSACDDEHDPYSPDVISAKRENDTVLVEGWISAGCSESIVNPRLEWEFGAANIIVSTKVAPGPVAACNCSQKFTATFSNKRSNDDQEFIYLVKNGRASAHTAMP